MNKPPGKISILMPSLRGGGVERQLLTLSDELTSRGFDLDLVLVNTTNSAYSPPSSLNVTDLGARHIRLAFFPLVKYLLRAKPQVMFSAETPVNALAIVSRLVSRYPKRLIVGERNHMSSVAKNARRLMDRLRPQLVRYLYGNSDLIVTVSSGVAEDLIDSCKIKPEKIRVIHNMFNIGKIIEDARAEPEHRWLTDTRQPVIISVGRLSPQKDHETLIRAFAVLRASRTCRLIILGEGPERSKLEKLVSHLNMEGDIFMPGFVANPFAYVARAKVFVLSSVWEGLPGALVEALACGTPVVSTDCPSGPAEILKNGRYGLLTAVGDAAALADAMQKMLKSPFPEPKLLYERAMEFSVETIIPEYINVLQG